MAPLFTGAIVAPPGYSRLPAISECEKENLRLLPELKRIRRTEVLYVFSLLPAVERMAAERGIDMYKDDEETLPEEIKKFWSCTRAVNSLLKEIEKLEAIKARQGIWWSASNLLTDSWNN